MVTTLLGKYQLYETIGTGTFGEVKKAKNLEAQQMIAIKFVRFTTECSSALYTESEVLSQLQGGIGIPKLFAYGKQEGFEFMVTELLGRNLMELFRDCQKQFSAATVAMIAMQALERIEFIHSRGYLHRDIKPQNLLIGLDSRATTIYLTDYGLAKRYMNEFYIHIPYKTDSLFAGTMYYASNNTHLGIQQSRRDDIEGLLNVLIYLHRGKLPWKQPRDAPKNSFEAIKLTITPAKLCEGLPDCYLKALKYVRALQFEGKPDYAYLRGMFRMFVQKYANSMKFDWEVVNVTRRKRRSKSMTPTKAKESSTAIVSVQPTPKRSNRKLATVQYNSGKTSVVDGHHTRSKFIGQLPTQPLSDDQESEGSRTIEDGKLPSFTRKSVS